MTAAYLTQDKLEKHNKKNKIKKTLLLSFKIFLALARLLSVLLTLLPQKKMPLVGQYLPNRLLVHNCPSASSNECQSNFTVAGVLTAVRVIIVESDGRSQGSFP